MSGKLKWYAARLAAMSPVELLHRIVEVQRKRALAAMVGGWKNFQLQNFGRVADLSFLRTRLAETSEISVDEVLTGARFLGREYSGFFDIGGVPVPGAWHRDPISGRAWPGAGISAFKVDVRSTSSQPCAERPYGDVKFVWEPNRLQILHPLSCIIARGGEEGRRAKRVALGILESWMAANPPYRGVNWLSGIELALRLVAVSFLAASMQDQPDDSEGTKRIAAFVAGHAHMLHALPSLYSSANNHLVAEGLGLFLAGYLLPELDAEKGYKAEGRRILEAEALLQIFPDGVGGEQSPTYQAFTMELIAFAALLARESGNDFSPEALERLMQGARFLCALQDSCGHVPSIGDNDEGRVILAPHVDEPLYVASVAGCVGALCGNSAELATARPGYLREAIFLAETDAPAPETGLGLQRFSDGGYSVLHQKILGRDVHLVFDHAPLGYLALAAHGHADALALWLSVDGAPVFIDAGTWLYNSGEATRSEFRSSRSHNTLSLPGLSQSEPSPAFSWTSKANVRALEPDPDIAKGDSIWAMAGEHDGYKGRTGAVHRRDIVATAHGLVIADRLSGTREPLPVEISFLCDPSISPRCEKGGVTLWREGKCVLRLEAPRGFEVIVLDEHSANPPLYSPRFGHMQETARILLKGLLSSQPCLSVIEFETITPG